MPRLGLRIGPPDGESRDAGRCGAPEAVGLHLEAEKTKINLQEKNFTYTSGVTFLGLGKRVGGLEGGPGRIYPWGSIRFRFC